MSSLSATRRASSASLAEQQPCLWFARGLKIGSRKSAGPSAAHASCASSPCRMKTPITSWPASLRSQAATLESTPPDIARTMRDMRGKKTGDRGRETVWARDGADRSFVLRSQDYVQPRTFASVRWTQKESRLFFDQRETYNV